MRDHFYQKRIPTVLALILVIGGVFATSYFVRKTTNTTSHAAPDPTPQNVQIANVTDTSFTVVFETLERTAAAINVRNGSSTSLQFDDREPQNSTTTYYSHIFTVKNLAPHTPYSFTLVSNGNTYTKNGSGYQVTTAGKIAGNISKKIVIKGTVMLPDGQRGKDTLITATLGKSQLLAAVTTNEGTYTIERPFVLDSTLTHLVSLTNSTKATLSFFQQDMQTRATLLSSDIASIPTLTLTQNYDFTNKVGTQPGSATVSASFSIPQTSNLFSAIAITSPKDNANLIDGQPVFSGIALPFNRVSIEIKNASINTSVNTDSYGNWSYRPLSPLPVGGGSITIKSPDANNITRSVTQSFTIMASGSQVAQSATPSATPIFTPSPTSSPEPTSLPPDTTQTPAPTATAIPIQSPTQTPTVSQSPSLSPIVISVTVSPSARPTLEPTGSNSVFALTFAAIAFIFTGATILFLL